VSRPSARDLAEARARLGAVTGWLAAREGSSQPGPAAIDAAARILAAPPTRRDASVSVHPATVHRATVHRVQGHLVALYHLGSHGGPIATGECSCPDEGLCEHLLVALAGTTECQGGRESLAGAVAALVPAEAAEAAGGALEVTRLRARVAELETENADLIRAAGLGLQ
jgi:hypothetical protein